MSDTAAVVYGAPGAPTTAFQSSHVSNRPVEDVVTALKKGIDADGLLVLNEIDPQKAVTRVHHAMGGARLIFFFHPNLVVRLLQLDWTAMVEAPLKLAVIEQPDGTVAVRWADPAVALARYGNPALAAFGTELAGVCERVVIGSLT